METQMEQFFEDPSLNGHIQCKIFFVEGPFSKCIALDELNRELLGCAREQKRKGGGMASRRHSCQQSSFLLFIVVVGRLQLNRDGSSQLRKTSKLIIHWLKYSNLFWERSSSCTSDCSGACERKQHGLVSEELSGK
jgi:hypothetical protein